MGRLASAARAHRLALSARSIYAAANGWRTPSWNSELADGRHNGPNDRGETERLWREGAQLQDMDELRERFLEMHAESWCMVALR